MNDDERQRQVDALIGGLDLIRDLHGHVGHWALLDRLRLEGEIWNGPAYSIGAEAYRDAAKLLSRGGHEEEAATLERLAATDAEVRHAAWEWEIRMPSPAPRPGGGARAAAADRPVPFRLPGVTGIDGVSYAETTTAIGELAVLAEGIPGLPEIVTGFADESERAEWLADRTLSQLDRTDLPPGAEFIARFTPLASCVSGPPCRTAREEQVLARLLRDGDPDGRLTASLTHRMFTSHARAEIYAAWCEGMNKIAGDGVWPRELATVLIALDRRILRAPDWGLEAAGLRRRVAEPARSYLHRLVVTPVTQEQAVGAIRELVAESTVTARSRIADRAPHGAQRLPLPAQPDPGLLQRPDPGLGPCGPEPRM